MKYATLELAQALLPPTDGHQIMTSFFTLRRSCAVTIAVGFLFAWHTSAGAKAGLTVTLPQGAVLPSGPDFATDVLKDPWDFSNQDDLNPDPGETSGWCTSADVVNPAVPTCNGKTAFSLSNGLAGGTAKTDDATLGLLFTGYSNVVNPGRTGLTTPIDTSKYKKLAFRMTTDIAGNDPQVFWFPVSWFDPADAAVPPNFDRNFGEMVVSKTVAGFNTYLVDLTQAQLTGPAWTSAPMKGLRIDPNNTPGGSATGAGHDFSFDWVRLTYADSDPAAAKQTIQWSGGSGTTKIDVYDATNTTFVVNAGSGLSGSAVSWNYGVLPPGSYTLRVSRSDGSSGTQTFTVNTPPTISITAPSRTSGEDYATTVLGNAWDMSDQNDIVVIGSENFLPTSPLDLTTVPGALTGTNVNSDPNTTLLTNTNNGAGAKAIDTSKYRYLTYRMSIDGPVDIGNGSIARVHWASGVMPNNFTTTRDILVFAGMQSYTIDLASLSSSTPTAVAPFGGLEPGSGTCQGNVCTQEPWTTINKTQLRFDPDEFDTNPGDPMPFRAFHIDDVKLTAKPVAVGSYTIKFAAADADAGDTVTVSLYRTSDTNGSNKVAIASGLAAAPGQFVWNTTAVASGEYYVYAEVTDGKNVVGTYSDAPVVVSSVQAMAIDTPAPQTTVTEPFYMSGWAIETSTTGPGDDAVHLWAFPANGGSPVFLGAADYFLPRSDVAGIYGSQYLDCGYRLLINTLDPGTYTLAAYAHNATTGTFTQTRSVVATIGPRVSRPAMSIDVPGVSATVGPSFVVSGWAIDMAALPGSAGVDAVHVYAFNAAGTPTFLGVAASGQTRSDVGNVFGSQFTPSGYSLTSTAPLAPGPYTLAVYAHSTISGAFFGQARAITVRQPGDPFMSIDTPGNGASLGQPFLLAGWAIDRDSTNGPGVDAIHVWAFPAGGGSPVFISVAQLNFARNDVGAIFGPQFTNSGYNVSVSGLPAGQYQIVAYAHSSVTGTFNQAQAVNVTVH